MKLLYKHILKDFFEKKTMVCILSLFFALVSVLYYFVHFSVDKNLAALEAKKSAGVIFSGNEERYLVALQSNRILARNISFSMIGIFSIILFLYIKNTLNANKVKIGHLQSFGFKMSDIVKVYFILTLALSFICCLVGMEVGYFASDVLINANKQTYSVENVQKGIYLRSFIIGTVLISLWFAMISYIAGITVRGRDIALMIKNMGKQGNGPGFTEKFIQKMPVRDKFAFKLTMKNISAVLLITVAIVTFNIMFVLSVSLILSGNAITKSQKSGRNYMYDVHYEFYNTDKTVYNDSGNIPYIRIESSIDVKDKQIDYSIVGLDKTNDAFELLDKEGKKISISDGIVLNPELKENYGIKVGDTITLSINDANYELKVMDVAENASLKTIYMSKKQLARMLQIDENSYNGVLTDETLENGTKNSFEDKITDLENSLTSNKSSAIINQGIGIVIGCLLIYLAIFIGLNNNMNSILIFNLLGYKNYEINKILLNPYMLISNLIFFLTLPIGIQAARRIQVVTSITTNDYMPFHVNMLTIAYMFVVLNVLCLIVRTTFIFKVKSVIGKEQQAEFLCEW